MFIQWEDLVIWQKSRNLKQISYYGTPAPQGKEPRRCEMTDFEPTFRKYTNLNIAEMGASTARELEEIEEGLKNDAQRKLKEADRQLQQARLLEELRRSQSHPVPDFVIADRVQSIEGVVIAIGREDNGTTTVQWDEGHTSVLFTSALHKVKTETLSQAIRRLLEQAGIVDDDLVAISNMVIAARRKPDAPI
jgi:hypothetical protein